VPKKTLRKLDGQKRLGSHLCLIEVGHDPAGARGSLDSSFEVVTYVAHASTIRQGPSPGSEHDDVRNSGQSG
jgi:hypothetical protein